MTHQQILDKLAARHVVQSMDEDLAILTFYAMCYEKQDTGKQLAYLLPKLLLRWNCVLEADKEVTDNYKQKTALALSILLHKYGFADKKITTNALKAIDDLNEAVALSDDFFRKSDEIKKFITAAPVPLKKKPSTPETMTFYRAQDVIAIRLNNKFYAAYIIELTGPNESPIIEFYNGVFDEIPTLKMLEKLSAKGQVYNDGIERIARFSVSGMKFLPDLANQIHLIKAAVETPPSNSHLTVPSGLYSVEDLFQIQETIQRMFP